MKRWFPVLLVAGFSVACSSSDDGGGDGSGGNTTPINESGQLAGITAAHNRVRDSLNADIPPLEWDTNLAGIAQAWSENLASSGCGLTHSQGNLGENLAFLGGQNGTADRVVDLWASEAECYTFGEFLRTDSCTGSCGACGHYTQIVWRTSERLGCGVAACPNGAEIWTCNYDPPGNFIGMEPY